MPTIKTVPLADGTQVKAKDVEFRVVKEDWNEYVLSDGTIVKVRITVGKILRVLDDKGDPTLTPDGDPFVIIQSRNEVVTSG